MKSSPMMGPMSQAAAALGTKPSASVTGGEAESMKDAAVCWWFVIICNVTSGEAESVREAGSVGGL